MSQRKEMGGEGGMTRTDPSLLTLKMGDESHEPRNMSGVWKLKKAKIWVLLSRLQTPWLQHNENLFKLLP